MERLTTQGFDFETNFVASNLQSWPIAQALKKLQAYEDRGLEPEEIPTGYQLANVYAALQELKRYESIGTVEQFRKLLDADQKRRAEGYDICTLRGPCKYQIRGGTGGKRHD